MINTDPDYKFIIDHRDEAILSYQPIFSPTHIQELKKGEFESFLNYENSCHWTGFQQGRIYLTRYMQLLRQSLNKLLDENKPRREWLNKLLPYCYKSSDSYISHLGILILTSILLVANPDKHGVWNKTPTERL
jgi:hypothetical protein